MKRQDTKIASEEVPLEIKPPRTTFTPGRSIYLRGFNKSTLGEIAAENVRILKSCPFSHLVYGSSNYDQMGDEHTTRFGDIDIFSKSPFNLVSHLVKNMKIAPFELYTVINALHKTTIRFRVNNRTLTDITYMDRSIFNLLYKCSPVRSGNFGRMLHPFFQMVMMSKVIVLSGQSYISDINFGFSDTAKFKKVVKNFRDIISNPPEIPEVITDTLICCNMPNIDEYSVTIPKGQVVSGVAALVLYESVFGLTKTPLDIKHHEDGFTMTLKKSNPIAPVFIYSTDEQATGRITYKQAFNDCLFNLQFTDPTTFVYDVEKLPPQFSFMSLTLGENSIPVATPMHLFLEFGCLLMMPLNHAKLRPLWLPMEEYYGRLCKLMTIEMADKIQYHCMSSMYEGYIKCPPILKYSGYEGNFITMMQENHGMSVNRESKTPEYMDKNKFCPRFYNTAKAYANSWGMVFKSATKHFEMAHQINA